MRATKASSLPARCSPSATAASLPETTHTALMRSSTRICSPSLSQIWLPPIDAACALPVTVSSYESAPESMASIVSSSVITFVTLAGSRGVCSSLAKSTVPVCFSIKRAEGASSVSSSARTGTHKSSANSRIIGNIRFMAELLSSFGKEYERIYANMNISP